MTDKEYLEYCKDLHPVILRTLAMNLRVFRLLKRSEFQRKKYKKHKDWQDIFAEVIGTTDVVCQAMLIDKHELPEEVEPEITQNIPVENYDQIEALEDLYWESPNE